MEPKVKTSVHSRMMLLTRSKSSGWMIGQQGEAASS